MQVSHRLKFFNGFRQSPATAGELFHEITVMLLYFSLSFLMSQVTEQSLIHFPLRF